MTRHYETIGIGSRINTPEGFLIITGTCERTFYCDSYTITEDGEAEEIETDLRLMLSELEHEAHRFDGNVHHFRFEEADND